VACCSAKDFFSEGTQKLLERWNKCIAKHGEYNEKLNNCKVSAVVEINYKNCDWIHIDLPSYIDRSAWLSVQAINTLTGVHGFRFRLLIH